MIVVALCLAATLAMDAVNVFSIHRRSGVHVYSIRMVTGPFLPHGRRLKWVRVDPKRDGYLPGYRIGSNVDYFWHGYEPVGYPHAEVVRRSVLKELESHTEIRSLTVTIDGRRRTVHPALYRDLLDPHDNIEQLLTTLSPDGKTLWMRDKGSVHGAAYWVMWILHANGKQTRVDDDGPHYHDE